MLNNMNYVYAVYLKKSFSKAAEELHISQPALSMAIKKVEEKIGFHIFDRSSNPIELTSIGKYYIRSIEKIMNIEEEMNLYFSSLKENNKEVINIGSASFFSAHILPKIVQDFRMVYPKYSVNLLEANASDLTKRLEEGIFDVILDVEKVDDINFKSRWWAEEQILLAVPTDYEVNNKLKEFQLTFEDVRDKQFLKKNKPKVDLKEFEYEKFLLLKKGNDLYERSLNMCKDAGFTPQVSMYLDQLLTAYYVANSGNGITFVRAEITQFLEPTDKIIFYKINNKKSIRSIMLYHKKPELLSKAVLDFIEFLYENRPVKL